MRCDRNASSDTNDSWAACIINHGSYDDLDLCLRSIRRQTIEPAEVRVFDTGTDPSHIERLRSSYQEVEFVSGENRGYAGGANYLLSRLAESPSPVAFALLLNPDVVLEPEFTEVLLREIRDHPEVAIASGKLLRPGGVILDSSGIRLPRNRRPRDRGSGEIDRGQYDRCEPVFAVSGAAMLLRRSALSDLALDGELFDEDFFLYHEDTDLCWRARRLGWKVLYVPTARAEHGRRWRPSNRHSIQPAVRRHSFKNHYLQILKNEEGGDFLRHLPTLFVWEGLRLGFALLRDPKIIGGYVDALRVAPRIWAKRKLLAARSRRARVREQQPRTRALSDSADCRPEAVEAHTASRSTDRV